MITDEQIAQLTAAFGKAMTQVDSDVALALLRDAFGIDPEVYEWNQGEIMKAMFKKVGSLDEGGLNRLLAKMAVAGGKEACKVVSALFIATAAENSVTWIAEEAPEGIIDISHLERKYGILHKPEVSLESYMKASPVPETLDTE